MPDSIISSILARLDALEALDPGETLQPNYLSINPATGQIGANFSGLIQALGLILPAAGSSLLPYPQNSSIEWVRQSDGAVVAQQSALSSGGTESLEIRSYRAPGGDNAIVGVGTSGGPNAGPDVLLQLAGLGGLGQVSADVFAENIPATILNNLGVNGGSSFVRYVFQGGVSTPPGPPVSLYVTIGSINVTFSGSNFSATVGAVHGLPGTPQFVVGQCITGAGIGVTASPAGPVAFNVTGWYPFGTLTQNAAVVWLAAFVG